MKPMVLDPSNSLLKLSQYYLWNWKEECSVTYGLGSKQQKKIISNLSNSEHRDNVQLPKESIGKMEDSESKESWTSDMQARSNSALLKQPCWCAVPGTGTLGSLYQQLLIDAVNDFPSGNHCIYARSTLSLKTRSPWWNPLMTEPQSYAYALGIRAREVSSLFSFHGEVEVLRNNFTSKLF